jgi:hypothetical protein
MPTYILTELAGDGTVSSTILTDPVSVTEAIDVPLASLLPQPAPVVAAPAAAASGVDEITGAAAGP